jgi:hypothetical protein
VLVDDVLQPLELEAEQNRGGCPRGPRDSQAAVLDSG